MISAKEFESRRGRMLGMMEENSAMLLFSGVGKVSSADEDYDFEVNRNFYYLTGIEQQDSALLLVNSMGESKEFLFISPFDERKEKWYGKRLTRPEANAISGIQNIQFIESLTAKIDEVLNPSYAVFGKINKLYIDLDREIKIAPDTFTSDYAKSTRASYSYLEIANAYPLLTTLRLRKSKAEVDELRTAIEITKSGIYSIWNSLAPNKKEYEMADTFLHTINDLSGYQGLSFPTIAASGRHGTCLHYPTPLDTMKDGDLLLTDLGARYSYYCADITRVAPVNGKFSEEQKKIYKIVLGCNQMVAEMARPGLTIADLQKATIEYLTKECLKAGYIENQEDIKNYYFHGVSHFIGLDTHDPFMSIGGGEYKNVPLEPGMIISDEPGLYMADRGIGIRIEDDLLITEDGCEVLSASIVKDPDEVEELLAQRNR